MKKYILILKMTILLFGCGSKESPEKQKSIDRLKDEEFKIIIESSNDLIEATNNLLKYQNNLDSVIKYNYIIQYIHANRVKKLAHIKKQIIKYK